MKKIIALSAVCLWTGVLMADGNVKPLNVKTGLWETTATTTAYPRRRPTKTCVTKGLLNSNPFIYKTSRCELTVIKSTGTNFELRKVCGDGSSKIDTRLSVQVIDSEHVQTSLQTTMTMDGRTRKIMLNLTSKWLGAVCPARTGN